jgi:hypothetical protein
MKKMIFVLTITGTIMACSKSNSSSNNSNSNSNGNGSTTVDCSAPKTFAADANPVLQSSCALAGCHANGSTNGPGALTTYQQIFNNRTIIRAAVASGVMPQNSTLSAASKNAILCWIDNGTQNN